MTLKDFYRQSTLPVPKSTGGDSYSHIKRIGPFRVDSILSKSPSSAVYIGTNPSNNSPIVIKILLPKFIKNKDMVDKFLMESKIIGMTSHKNIIKSYGQGTWEGGLYIAMEFIQGISLKQFIMKKNLSIDASLDIIMQISHALLHLHSHGVIHRDLKPENLLITEDGSIKLIDFGIAQIMDGHPTKIKSEGTLDYMSPEQKETPSKVFPSSDIYSLGIISCELITGKISLGEVTLDTIPPKMREIISKAIASNPKERYQDIVDFIEDLTEYISNVPHEFTDQTTDKTWNQLEKSHKDFLLKLPPRWANFEIGIARRNVTPTVYQDFITLYDNSHIIILSEYQGPYVEGILCSSLLKGMLHTLIRSNDNKTISTASIAESLNELTISIKVSGSFAMQIIHLSARSSSFSFTSCGTGSIIHANSLYQKSHFIKNDNPLIGERAGHKFSSHEEDLYEDDQLILYPSIHHPAEETKSKADSSLRKKIFETSSLSSQSQANHLMDFMEKTFPNIHQNVTNIVLSIQYAP